MYNEFNEHKKKDGIKWVVVFIALIVLFVGMVAALIPAYAPNKEEAPVEQEQTTTPETSNTTVVGNIEEHGIRLMSASLLSTEYADYGVSAAAVSAHTITATVLPATTTNKAVDWSVEFVNPTSTWANGKNASDYVSVEPSSDGSTTAVVSALKGFGEQIKIVCTSRSNSDISASCTVDYGKRLADTSTITCVASSIFQTDGVISSAGITTIEPIKGGNWQGMVQVYSQAISYTPSYLSDYTVENSDETVTIAVKPTDEFYTQLKAQGIARTSNTWNTLTTLTNGKVYEGLCNVALVPTDGLDTVELDNVNLFNTAVSNCSGAYDFEIQVSVTTEFETKNYIFQCLFNRNGAAFTATNMSLSESNIVL